MRRGLYVLLGVLLVPTVGLVGDVVTDGKFKSTLSSGAPLEVASPDMVANLNADMVDGLEASDFASASNTYTKAEVDEIIDNIGCPAPLRPWRKYYVTSLAYTADGATTACDSGFHFASLFEIYDVSNFEYDTDHPQARINQDSGDGPPTFVVGWVRTGGTGGSPGTIVPGEATCLNWESSSPSEFGTSIYLIDQWSTSVPGSPWVSAVSNCDSYLAVWCFEDY